MEPQPQEAGFPFSVRAARPRVPEQAMATLRAQFAMFHRWLARSADTKHPDFIINHRKDTAVGAAVTSLDKELTNLVVYRLVFGGESVPEGIWRELVYGFL